jgi:hypothetical protein
VFQSQLCFTHHSSPNPFLFPLEIHPPHYPLSREAFTRALVTGHGRALIHAERFGVADFREEILHAATTSLVYDTQMNGQREWWLARLCEFAGLVETIIELRPDESSRNRSLRSGLLKEFHLAGHSNALRQLRAMCQRTAGSNDVEAISDLIEADGVHGLVFAARKLGEELLGDPEFWVSDYELWMFDEIHGKGMGKALLAQLAPDDFAIRHYLQELTAYEKRSEEREKSSSSKPTQSADSVIQTILSATKPVYHFRRWANHASPADRLKVESLLKTEKDTLVLANVLGCLCGRPLSHFDPALLEFAFHENDDVSYRAGRLFANHDEPPVRLAGLALLTNGDLATGLQLLRKSAREEDTEAIVVALAKDASAEDPHGPLMDVIMLLESHESIQDARLALFIYEFTPCMHCRRDAVEFLIKWGKCPAWLLEEAAKDGCDDIRKLAAPPA